MSKTRRWIDRQQTPNTEEDEMRNRLEEIRERAEKATAGPWYRTATPPGWAVENITKAACEFDDDGIPNAFANLTRPNADFIAHAREDIPFLLSLLDKPTTCFECNTPLNGPYCPKCNPDTARYNALEEAAKVAEGWPAGSLYHPTIAEAIRAMKGQR